MSLPNEYVCNTTDASGVGELSSEATTGGFARVRKRAVFQPLDLQKVTLAGELGRRVDRIIEANILAIDIEQVFLADFRQRIAEGYTGFGKFIDATVRLAAALNDERLIALKKKAIAQLIATQDPDGYIGIIKDPQARIKVLWDLHESAYLIWALVSDYRLFRSTDALNAAQRLADYVLARFAADPSTRPQYPCAWTFEVTRLGLDQALLALSRETAQQKYRDFVVRFLKLPEYDEAIHCGTTSGAAHVATYLGMCLAQLDLYDEMDDPRLLRSTTRAMTFLRRGEGLLVTGSCSDWECWHDTQSGLEKTSETCASTFMARVTEALLRLEGASVYGDMLERNIYNSLFAATAPDGTRSRYHTPFDGERVYDPHGHRMCCANNNKRFLADLRTWIYYRTELGIAVNLYNSSVATFDVGPGLALRIEQQTSYPTSGEVLIKVDPSRQAHFEVKLRIPRWCRQAMVAINGSTPTTVSGGQFYGINRHWKSGDFIQLSMPMDWRFIRGRRSQVGRAAVLRGPVIFTFNPAQNSQMCAGPGFEARSIIIDPREVELPRPDTSGRPDGLLCSIRAWPPGGANPWPMFERVSLTLTEYPDPGGRAIYFLVPGEGKSILVDDELLLME